MAQQIVQKAQHQIHKILDKSGASRTTEVKNPFINKTINTPNYIFTTKGGALNGMVMPNLRNVDFPFVSYNFADIHSYSSTFKKYQQHLLKTKEQGNLLKRYFRHEDKLTILTPFPYSHDKERVSGYNDEAHLQLNGKEKVKIEEYYDLFRTGLPDYVVAPCEQVTNTGGKKKRKRAAKAAIKSTETMHKIIKELQGNQSQLIVPVVLGDEDGQDSYEMRMFRKQILQNEDLDYCGYIVYGNEDQFFPAKYQEMLDFFNSTPEDKIRILHGTGNPLDVLNGILSGVDLFEGDYPLELAQLGIAIDLKEFKMTKKQKERKGPLELSKLLEQKQMKTMNMKDYQFQKSEDPVQRNCKCYCCKNYNRAYLYHLLEVDEMNAYILIGMHNLWVYERFFQQLRSNLRELPLWIEDFVEFNCEEKE